MSSLYRSSKFSPTLATVRLTVLNRSLNIASNRINMSGITQVSANKSFGGWQKVFSHESSELKCKMNFGVYIPAKAEDEKVPVLFYLSGLTCTEQNVVTKAGAQQFAAKHGIMFVAPDTSPRGCGIEGEDDAYDFGSGAGFYVDATEDKWKTNYRMYSYITQELPAVIEKNFNVDISRMGITGHSMGGHGAIMIALRNPGKYRSVSAFAPICNPMNCAWGQKAFSGYLGSKKETWEAYDSCEVAKKYSGPPVDILVDQGKSDNFLKEGQLLPDNLVAACASAKIPITLRMHEDYDHSYYFMASFMEDHINHHAKYLNA